MLRKSTKQMFLLSNYATHISNLFSYAVVYSSFNYFNYSCRQINYIHLCKYYSPIDNY